MASKARELADAIGERETAGGLVSGRKNLIINGAMQVAQRGTSVTGAANRALCLDRFMFNANRDEAVVDLSQATDAPTGFKYSKKITITTAETTVDAGNYIQTEYALEGNDISHLAYGTSNAKTLTLSFWVKSSSTGVFPVTLSNSGGNYHYPSSYTIDTANTWEYKTITISGATAGAWTTTGSSEGFRFRFGITYGSTYNGATANQWLSSASYANAFVTATNNVVTTTNATWQITGVQLEVGSVATPFEHRSYGEELALCRRYYKKNPALQGNFINSTGGFIAGAGEAIQTMRALPTLTLLNGTDAVHVSHVSNYTVTGIDAPHLSYLRCSMSSSPGGTTPGHFRVDKIAFDAEL